MVFEILLNIRLTLLLDVFIGEEQFWLTNTTLVMSGTIYKLVLPSEYIVYQCTYPIAHLGSSWWILFVDSIYRLLCLP